MTRFLIAFLIFLTYLYIYQRKKFLDHLLMIMIASGHTKVWKRSIYNTDWIELVPMYL